MMFDIKSLNKSLELQLEVKEYREQHDLKKWGYNYEELGELYLANDLKQQCQ